MCLKAETQTLPKQHLYVADYTCLPDTNSSLL